MEQPANLGSLPSEILSRVVFFTDAKSLVPLRRVNHRLHDITDEPTTLRSRVIYSQPMWDRKMNPPHSLDIQKLSYCLGSDANLWLRFAVVDAVAFDYVQTIEKNWIEELFPGEEETRYSCPPLPWILERHAQFLVLFKHPVVSNRHFAMNLAKRGLHNTPSDLDKFSRSLIFVTSIFLVSPAANLWPSSGLYSIAANVFRDGILTIPERPDLDPSMLLRLLAIVVALSHASSAFAERRSRRGQQRNIITPPRFDKMPFYSTAFAKDVIAALEADERQHYEPKTGSDIVGNDTGKLHIARQQGYHAATWSRLLGQVNSQQADRHELSRGCWAGYYTGWALQNGAAPPHELVDPIMKDIRFATTDMIHVPGEEDSYNVRARGLDDVGVFTLEGFVKTNGEGRLRKSYSMHSWDWVIWVTAWGIFGFWGDSKGESPLERTEHRWRDDVPLGLLWMWNRGWEEPAEEDSTS